MPHSLVLNFLPVSPIPQGYLTGRHLHALFLTLVSSVDKTLGDYLHQSETDKAFTLSPLQLTGYRGHTERLRWEYHKPISEGTPCWWRISLLDDTLFAKLTHLWLNLNPDRPWHLGPADLKITSILGTPQSTQPWANACTYEQLYHEASESTRSFHFTLSTPSAFRQCNYDTALPTRESIFNSLLNRWNKYSNIPIPSIFIESIFPSFFDIHTEMVADSRSKFIGCVGDIHYRILENIDPIHIKHFNVLANYALYCGIGRKTPMGMGMVRRVNS